MSGRGKGDKGLGKGDTGKYWEKPYKESLNQRFDDWRDEVVLNVSVVWFMKKHVVHSNSFLRT